METGLEAGVGMAPTPPRHGIYEKYLGKTLSEVCLFSGEMGIPWMYCGSSLAAINRYKCIHFSGGVVSAGSQVL